MLAFTVYGVAQPKGNMKPFFTKGMKFPIVTESNRNVKSWSQLVAEGASHALQELPPGDRAQLTCGVRLTLAFYLPRPKKFEKKDPVPHITAPDWDKLSRAVGDALEKVLYANDAQVCEAIVGKYYAPIGGVPHVDVRVERTAGLAALVTVPKPIGLPLFEAVR